MPKSKQGVIADAFSERKDVAPIREWKRSTGVAMSLQTNQPTLLHYKVTSNEWKSLGRVGVSEMGSKININMVLSFQILGGEGSLGGGEEGSTYSCRHVGQLRLRRPQSRKQAS
jgi:hypothetical protein